MAQGRKQSVHSAIRVSEGYCGISKLTVYSYCSDINLYLSDDEWLKIEGRTLGITEINGRMLVNQFTGRIGLPKPTPEVKMMALDFDISGNVKGDVAHKGVIRVQQGEINLELYAPLNVRTHTEGQAIVRGMSFGLYAYPNRTYSLAGLTMGQLELISESKGDICLNYHPNADRAENR
jgi:hypothetical protein